MLSLKLKRLLLYALLVVCGILIISCVGDERVQSQQDDFVDTNTGIATEPDDKLLIFTLLDGSFVAIDRVTGDLLWKHSDSSPVVSVPTDTSDAIHPLYLPDPRDGSLYLLAAGTLQPLKKLPFSIPQLVASSPCRSSDSILYTGSKRDSWYLLDRVTGDMREVLGWNSGGGGGGGVNGGGGSSTCPAVKSRVFLGRTQYTVLMVDSKNDSKKWNVSFSEYTAPPIDIDDLTDYEYVHLGCSSCGRVVTLDRRTGRLQWTIDLESPIIGTFLLDSEGLVTLPFTSMSSQTLESIANDGDVLSHLTHQKLYATLYVGVHNAGLYAIPSLIERTGLTISDASGEPLMIDGTTGSYNDVLATAQNLPNLVNSDSDKLRNILYLGHYHTPEYTVADSSWTTHGNGINGLITHVQEVVVTPIDKSKEFPEIPLISQETDNNAEVFDNLNARNLIRYVYVNLKSWINAQENIGLKLLLIVMAGCVVTLVWYSTMQRREMRQWSQNGSKTNRQLSDSGNSVASSGATSQIPEELEDGTVRVGKIEFNPKDLLGKGCEGTFVYRGSFDGRQVAVKRLLPECFSLADREVALLRESDTHPNVIRYHCTEQDRMFRYIALELCDATVHDYVHGTGGCRDRTVMPSGLEILKQATQGLAHLHALDIVHRDIKPQNVLLSMGGGPVRAMISDFGLCKKLQKGKMSFSRRSGITGTEGWIAPEMLTENGNGRTTFAVDLFSLGCLYHYVLTGGCHPYGDALHRQAAIIANRPHLLHHQLSTLVTPRHLAVMLCPLITALLSDRPDGRPTCPVVLAHPVYWNAERTLGFLQDVSDWVERYNGRREEALGDDGWWIGEKEHEDKLRESMAQLMETTNEKSTDSVGKSTDDTWNTAKSKKSRRNSVKSMEYEENWGKKLEMVIVRGDWRAHVDESITEDLRRYRTYRGNKVRDLLRALRNKKHHFRELSPTAQAALGDPPAAFTRYWTTRFPHLVTYTWLAMQSHVVSSSPSRLRSISTPSTSSSMSTSSSSRRSRSPSTTNTKDRLLSRYYHESHQCKQFPLTARNMLLSLPETTPPAGETTGAGVMRGASLVPSSGDDVTTVMRRRVAISSGGETMGKMASSSGHDDGGLVMKKKSRIEVSVEDLVACERYAVREREITVEMSLSGGGATAAKQRRGGFRGGGVAGFGNAGKRNNPGNWRK